jgi:hypothetical protein
MKIPQRLHTTIHTFCSDMWEGYLNAIGDFMEANPISKPNSSLTAFMLLRIIAMVLTACAKKNSDV